MAAVQQKISDQDYTQKLQLPAITNESLTWKEHKETLLVVFVMFITMRGIFFQRISSTITANCAPFQ